MKGAGKGDGAAGKPGAAPTPPGHFDLKDPRLCPGRRDRAVCRRNWGVCQRPSGAAAEESQDAEHTEKSALLPRRMSALTVAGLNVYNKKLAEMLHFWWVAFQIYQWTPEVWFRAVVADTGLQALGSGHRLANAVY